MTSVTFAILAIIFYSLTTFLIVQNLRSDRPSIKLILIVGGLAIICHALQIFYSAVTTTGINLGLFNALSLSSMIISTMVVSALWFRRLEVMALIILPISAIIIIFALLFQSSHQLPSASGHGLLLHIVVSIVAYSIMGLAAFHAILLAVQNRQLHNHQTTGIVQFLPPLKEMERLLFEIIIVGFVLLSVALLSGFAYLENLFAQHLAHKTILSILAWLLFAILLIGHWLFGWRGRTAVRWTLGGFICLMLAYIGSKFVLEFIIG